MRFFAAWAANPYLAAQRCGRPSADTPEAG